MTREIRHRFTNAILWSGEAETVKDAVHAAIASGADLSGANLSGADLFRANLSGANLSGADLSGANNLTLPTGETWDDYLTETVPALLVAGGKSLASFAEHFSCHDWTNCPMAHAFDVADIQGVPLLLRPRAEQFIQFFDAEQIPWPLPTKAELQAARKKAQAETR